MTNQEAAYVLLLEEALARNNDGMLMAYHRDLLHHDKERLLSGEPDAVYTWVLRQSGTDMWDGANVPVKATEPFTTYVLDVGRGTLTKKRGS